MKKTTILSYAGSQNSINQQSQTTATTQIRNRSKTSNTFQNKLKKNNQIKQNEENIKIQEDSQQTNPAEYYKQKTKQYLQQIEDLVEQNNTLNDDNNKLRIINLNYVTLLNKLGHDKCIQYNKEINLIDNFKQSRQSSLKRKTLLQNNLIIQQQDQSLKENIESNEQSIIFSQCKFDNIKDPETKKVISKLTSRIKTLEEDLIDMIDHTKFMEKDIQNYLEKINTVSDTFKELEKQGVNSIFELTEKTNSLKKQLDQSVYDQKATSIQHLICQELNQRLKQQAEEIQKEKDQTKFDIEELLIKYNKMVCENEIYKKQDKNMIYQLRCKQDVLEQQCRGMQGSVLNGIQENQELNFQYKETENDNNKLKAALTNLTYFSQQKMQTQKQFNVKFK